MNRLERECLAGSLVMHTLLLLLAVVSAGFASRQKPTEEVVLLTFIPDILVDAPLRGGGTPQAPARAAAPPVQAPPAAPPQPDPKPPVPEPEPPPVRKPAPKKAAEEPAPKRTVPKDPAPEAEPATSPDGERPAPKRRIEPNLKPTTRPADQAKAERERAARAEAARAEAELQRLAGIREQRVGRLVSGLQQNLSGGTSVSVPGTGGATYASYTSYVDLIYRTAWAPLKPREATERTASVQVRVVIGRDGSVITSEIRKRSGNAALDRSVQAVLDRVRTIGRPFPEGARDDRREFDISFTLEAAGNAG